MRRYSKTRNSEPRCRAAKPLEAPHSARPPTGCIFGCITDANHRLDHPQTPPPNSCDIVISPQSSTLEFPKDQWSNWILPGACELSSHGHWVLVIHIWISCAIHWYRRMLASLVTKASVEGFGFYTAGPDATELIEIQSNKRAPPSPHPRC